MQETGRNDARITAKRSGGDDRRLAIMFEIARTIATEHDLGAMIHRLLGGLIQSVDAADAGVLLLYDPIDDTLKVTAAQGYELDALRALRIAPGESITGASFLSGRAAVYASPEATAAARSSLSPANQAVFRAASQGHPPSASAASVPLITDGTRIGVLLLEGLSSDHRFTAADLAFLEPVGDLLALAIGNARLRNELEAVRSLSEANRLKAEVVSTLAHELRTPLTSIKGYSSALLMDELHFSAETQREFLQIIDDECDVLQDLIHDLLESSVIEAGFLKLDPQPVLLARLVTSTVAEVQHLSARHRFLIDFPESFPVVEADPQRVTQVLRNLLDNAIKYSAGGGLVVVRGEVQALEVVISVADQGEGIAPQHLNRLFEKYFRINSALGRHVVGTGLGLPIARTIVEAHGGRIWAESSPGQGTTFFFTLPYTQESQERVERHQDD